MSTDWKQLAKDGFDLFGNFQSGYQLGSPAENGFQYVTNLLNFAAQVAPTLGVPGAAFGVGLNQAAAVNNTTAALDKWRNGTLQPSDILQITDSVLGGLAAAAVISGAAVPAGVAAVIALVGLAAGPLGKDFANGTVQGLYDWLGSSHQSSININQYLTSNGEFFTYQLVDKYGFNYEMVAHLSGTSISIGEHLPTGVVQILDPVTMQPIMEYRDSSQYDISGASLMNGTSVTLSDSQFNGILNNLADSSFSSNSNTVDFTSNLLESAGIHNHDFTASGSISEIYQTSRDFFDSIEFDGYYHDWWMDPGYSMDIDDPYYQGSGLNFDDFYMWDDGNLGWNPNDTMMCGYLLYKSEQILGNAKTSTRNAAQAAMNQGRYGSPIVIDLDGDGIKTVDLSESNVVFDINGDGALDRTGWLSGEDGFLAQDINHNGIIDGVSELFGGLKRGEGYSQLAAFDQNGDNLIDARDDIFSSLKIWIDKNSDGVSDQSELFSLEDKGISSLDLNYAVVNEYNNHNLIGESSSAVVGGRSVQMADVYFRYQPGTPELQPSGDAGAPAPLDADAPQAFAGDTDRPATLTSHLPDAAATVPHSPSRERESSAVANVVASYFSGGKSSQQQISVPVLDHVIMERYLRKPDQTDGQEFASSERLDQTIERHWTHLAQTLSRLDAERQDLPSWSIKSQGADISYLNGSALSQRAVTGQNQNPVGLEASAVRLNGFIGLQEGLGRLSF